ncbi:MAG: DUF1538 domain-containing protein [Treponema sp.]|nr:DUF1538 domain-containing protein [Treponema sp.]
MDIVEKFKETAKSVLPVIVIVLVLGLTIVPLEKIALVRFAVSGFLLIFGLTIFLMGVGMGIEPMGERCGSALVAKKNLPLLLSCAFAIGFIVTAAEPDIQVFADQVKEIFPFVNKLTFTFAIAGGVGLFLLLGLLRTILNFPIKIFFFVFYTLLFILAFFAPENFWGIAFDSGGATTGPMTVPFIMSLGLGVSAVRSSKQSDSSFGLTGTASIGPVMAVLVYSIFLKAPQGFVQEISEIQLEAFASSGLMAKIFLPFIRVFPIFLRESLFAISPLFILFIIFQAALLKMTMRQTIRILIGFVYAYIGLTIFLTGVNGGFSDAGRALGQTLGSLASNNGGAWLFLLILTGIAFGAVIVCAEPAVWVLSEQVEHVSGGTIKRKALLFFLSVGTALGIAIALLANVFDFNIKWILVIGYSISMLLMIFCPAMWTGIAFDSGGVASGPLTSTFILSFTIGAAATNPADSFGVIALVAMMPLSAIQIMGIIYKAKQRSKKEAK